MNNDTREALAALINAYDSHQSNMAEGLGVVSGARLKEKVEDARAALATQPAQPSPAQIAAVEELTQQSQKMGFYGECQMRLGIGRCECQESGLGGECIYRLSAPKPAQPSAQGEAVAPKKWTDGEIKALYVQRFGEDGWLGAPGSWFIEGVKAGYASAPAAPAQDDEAQMKAPQDGMQFWLWKNGDHFLAFTHLYPCFTPGGDPMVLGEPAGRAVFRRSHDRSDRGNATSPAQPELKIARSLTDELMDCVDRLGSEWREVDPRVWDHLRVYMPAQPSAQGEAVAWQWRHFLGNPDVMEPFWTEWEPCTERQYQYALATPDHEGRALCEMPLASAPAAPAQAVPLTTGNSRICNRPAGKPCVLPCIRSECGWELGIKAAP